MTIKHERKSESAEQSVSSRWPGFYKESVQDRVSAVSRLPGLSPESRSRLERSASLPLEVADRMSENVVGLHGLPLSLALNFRVNGADRIIPMAVEEPSVVAAASNAARLVRISGGFSVVTTEPIMTAQVYLEGVDDRAEAQVDANSRELLELANRAIPRMTARGGGCQRVEVRRIDGLAATLSVEIAVHVGDAMGANLVDTVAEAVAPELERLTGGTARLRILTNLTLDRRVVAECWVGDDALAGAADAMVSASRIAECDPARAVTHNKGIMNGIDAVAVAMSQDFRAIEAGAHGFAALSGHYSPLAVWRKQGGGILGRLEMPLAVGTVGGSVRVHPGVQTAMEVARVQGASDLAGLMASAGLASNLAALLALCTDGIQKGHMRLHARRLVSEEGRKEGVQR